MLRWVVIVSGFAALVLLATGRDARAQGDPIAVQQQLLEALARGDVAGALALFLARKAAFSN